MQHDKMKGRMNKEQAYEALRSISEQFDISVAEATPIDHNKLSVVVTGQAGAGKTMLAAIIEDALIDAGFNVDVFDIDINSSNVREHVEDSNLDGWKSRTDVVIDTVQLARTWKPRTRVKVIRGEL